MNEIDYFWPYSANIDEEWLFKEIIENNPTPYFPQNDTSHIKVVSFWASWCSPCLVELGVLDKITKSNKFNDVKFIALNFSDSFEIQSNFIRNKKYSYHFLKLLKPYPKDFNFEEMFMPKSFIVDKQNRLIVELPRFSESNRVEFEDKLSTFISNYKK